MDMNVNTQSTFDTENIYNYMNGFLMNPSAFIIVLAVVIIYIIIFISLGNTTIATPDISSTTSSSSSSSSSNIIIIVIVVMLAFLLSINALKYFFGFDIIASIKDIFLGNPVIDIKIIPIGSSSSPIPEIKYREQVFNVPGNYYGYNDAKALCSAYGSRLATYNEIEDSYNSGAEWCNYGWSEGQMALFPTQKSTFHNLQGIKGHENDCGRPGINGGYMTNPHIKFGVNCFGYKPKINSEEEELMQNISPYPKTKEDILMEKRIDYWKTKIDDILVSPFDYKKWSQ